MSVQQALRIAVWPLMNVKEYGVVHIQLGN